MATLPLHTDRPAAWDDPTRLVRIAAFAAMAIAGRVAFLWAPNLALTYYIVFLAGLLEGALAGAVVGLVAMTATNLMLSGIHPVLFANGPAMALLGLAGGLMRPWLLRMPVDRIDVVLRRTGLFALGLFGTFLFSVASDLVGYLMQYGVTPEGSTIGGRALVPYLMAGLSFNLLPALLNAALFAFVTPGLVRALQRSGHLPDPRPDATPGQAAPGHVPYLAREES